MKKNRLRKWTNWNIYSKTISGMIELRLGIGSVIHLMPSRMNKDIERWVGCLVFHTKEHMKRMDMFKHWYIAAQKFRVKVLVFTV